MAFRYLDKDGALSFWTNIKNYILSKIPTKTSELTNDSGFLTSHQSLANYVTTNTDQDITGDKNFKGLLTTIPSSSLWPSVSNTSDDITLLGGSVVHVEQKSSGKLTDLSGGAWNVVELGAGAFFFRNNTGTDIRYKHLYTGVVSRIPVVSGSNRFINDVTPNEDNTYSLGTSSLRWSSCYSNTYYLGTTAFGDIVTHNASEFLTAHQSLDNYVTTNTSQTITAIKIITGGNQGKMVFKNPDYTKGDAVESGTTISRLYFGNGASYAGANGVLTTDVNSSGNTSVELCAMENTANSSVRASLILTYDKSATSHRLLKSWGNFLPYVDNTYTLGNSSSVWKECYCNAYYLGTTSFGDIVTHNASEFLTEHPSITLSSNTTSTASPAHGGTFTCIDSVTQDTNGHITKVNTKTVTLPSDNNTDTKVKQYEGATNQERPILSRYNPTEASQTANFVVYDTGVTSNPAKHTITASGGFIGNASSATEFKDSKSVTLTGDVTGTVSSKAGWSVATTLANSGVTAGTYGPSADVTGSNNATILVPEITVDAKGRVTAVTNRTYKSVNTDSDKKVYQYYKSDDNVYRLLFSNNSGNTATSNVGAVYSGLNNSFYVNPSTGSLYATKLYSGGTEVKVTDYDTHIADTDIHVTTADKNRWNNQTYVFRYSSTALTPSSTNSNALLDNTDNLKVGDKVIDSSGVLFSITAIDTANSTFTIGTALIDLAQDSDVMHLSGNETADGLKTFLKYITSDGSSTGDEYSSNTRTNLWLMSNRDTEKVSGVLFDTYRQNAVQGKGIHVLGIGIKENSVRYEGCRFGWYWNNDLNGYSFDFKPTTAGANQALNHNLGTSYDKWDTINSINPGALSLPDLYNGIDISGYLTTGSTSNTYTALADGYISILTTSSTDSAIYWSDSNGIIGGSAFSAMVLNGGTKRVTNITFPVNKGESYIIVFKSVHAVVSAYFYPCQGNV